MGKKIVLFLMFLCCAGGAEALEVIKNYHSDIVVQQDGSIDVTETITVKAEGNQIRLGLYRDFPTVREEGGKKYRTTFDVMNVKRNGRNENFWVERNNGFKRLQIGARNDTPAGRLPYGDHTYEITYKSESQLRKGNGFDELYWNVTGNNWAFPIEKASAVIHLPEGAMHLQSASYLGRYGSTERGPEAFEEDGIRFDSGRRLSRKEGFTVAVGFTPDIVTIAEPEQIGGKLVRSAALVFIVLFAYYIVVWFVYGKDEKPTVTPLYQAPAGVSPTEGGIAYWGRGFKEKQGIPAAIVDLAARGFIEIGEKTNGHWTIKKLKGMDVSGFPEEQQMLKAMFPSESTLHLTGSYNPKMGMAAMRYRESVRKFIKRHVLRNRWAVWLGILIQIGISAFLGSAELILVMCVTGFLTLFYTPFFLAVGAMFKSRQWFVGLLLGLFIIPHYGAFITAMPIAILKASGLDIGIDYAVVIGSVIGTVIMHVVFSKLMDVPTEEGLKIRTKMAGLKMFILAVDVPRYKAMKADIFERNLPYAMVLGLEDVWTRKFQAVHPEYQGPSFYVGGRAFDAVRLMRCASRSATKPPSSGGSSGGGRSFGSGGGGFSGGGGGGGGGGGR